MTKPMAKEEIAKREAARAKKIAEALDKKIDTTTESAPAPAPESKRQGKPMFKAPVKCAAGPQSFQDTWPLLWEQHLKEIDKITDVYFAALNKEWASYEEKRHELWHSAESIWRASPGKLYYNRIPHTAKTAKPSLTAERNNGDNGLNKIEKKKAEAA